MPSSAINSTSLGGGTTPDARSFGPLVYWALIFVLVVGLLAVCVLYVHGRLNATVDEKVKTELRKNLLLWDLQLISGSQLCRTRIIMPPQVGDFLTGLNPIRYTAKGTRLLVCAAPSPCCCFLGITQLLNEMWLDAMHLCRLTLWTRRRCARGRNWVPGPCAHGSGTRSLMTETR